MSERVWTIEPGTLDLKPETGDPRARMTEEEWADQVWPDCPVCETTIDVQAISAPDIGKVESFYVVGRWQCPNSCDPRPALQG